MATDDKPTLEPFEGEDFEFPDFPDSLAALLLQDTCPSADLNEALKGFIEGECATSPGAGSSVNNDTLSNVEADSAGESACNGTGDGTQGGVPLSTLGRASSSSASSLASGLPARPVCQPSIRITTGIPGEQKAWAPVRTGMGPVAGYQGMDTQGHPYPHPFSTPTRLASSAAPAAPPPSNPEANEQAPAQVGKRRKPEPDLSKIEDPEERRRQRRLAKNRNTAAVSRQRKKAQLLSLEERVKQLEVDNSALKYWLAQREQQLQSQNVHLLSLHRDAGETALEREAWSEPAELTVDSSIATVLSYLLLLAWLRTNVLARLLVCLLCRTSGCNLQAWLSLEVELRAESTALGNIPAILNWEAFGNRILVHGKIDLLQNAGSLGGGWVMGMMDLNWVCARIDRQALLCR